MLGDYSENSTINFKFTTRSINGIPTTLTSGSLVIYKGSSVTNTNSGVTLTSNFNSIVGLNHVTIDTSSNSGFYSTGADYQIIVASGLINTIPVSGEVLESFSIRNRAIELFRPDSIEVGYNLQQAIRLILSASAGILTGATAGNTIYIKDINNTKSRITATVDNSGNRNSIIYDVT